MRVETWLAFAFTVPLFALVTSLSSTLSRADTMQVRATRLRSAADIADATAARSTMLALQRATKSCTSSSLKARIECVCNFKAELATMEAAYESIATKHPAWIKPNIAFSYVDPADGDWVLVTFADADNLVGMCRAH